MEKKKKRWKVVMNTSSGVISKVIQAYCEDWAEERAGEIADEEGYHVFDTVDVYSLGYVKEAIA